MVAQQCMYRFAVVMLQKWGMSKAKMNFEGWIGFEHNTCPSAYDEGSTAVGKSLFRRRF